MTLVIVTVVTVAVVTVVIVTYFSKNNLTPRKPMRFLRAAFRNLAMLGLTPDFKIAKKTAIKKNWVCQKWYFRQQKSISETTKQ